MSISTKPNPLLRPVSRSETTWHLHGPERSEPLLQIGGSYRIGQIPNMQFLSHEILLVVKLFDPLNAFWVDEKGAHRGAQEVGKARGESRKRFDENPRCSLSRQTNLLKYNESS